MKFVSPNAVPRIKRNFNAAIDRLFFFDDQTPESELTIGNWHTLVPKVRAGGYSFDGTVWKTGHVQGQGDSTHYYPANLGALQESTSGNSYSASTSAAPVPFTKPDIIDFLTHDVDNVAYATKPLGVNPRRLYGFGGNGYSAPDTRMLFAMKELTFPTPMSGKLSSPFTKTNSYYTAGGGYNSIYIQYWGNVSHVILQPKTANSVPDSDAAIAVTSWANVADPSLVPMSSGLQKSQLFIVERNELSRVQQIWAAGSGSGTPSYANYYNWRMLESVGMKDDATFNESAVKPFYYPIAGTPETPNISWAAILWQAALERVFIKLDATDFVARTVTPGQSVQITARKTPVAPVTNQQIFSM